MRYLKIIFPAFLFSLVFGLYLRTVGPSLYWQDAGIYLAGINVGGNVYPPGFPLYMMSANLFSRILFFVPFTVAIHIFSALAAVLACVFVYWGVCVLLSHSRLFFHDARGRREEIFVHVVAFLSGLFVGVTYTLWAQAINAEVYALHTLFFCVLFYLVLQLGSTGRIARDISRRQVTLIFAILLVYGLSYANHPATVLLIPLFLVLLWFERNIFFHLKVVFLALGIFLVAGFLPYVYLPIRAAALPPLNWGNPSNVERFVNFVVARDYLTGEQSFVLYDPHRVGQLLQEFVLEFGYFGIGVAVVGAVVLFRRERRVSYLLFALIASHLSITYAYKQESEFNFWLIPVHICLIVFGAYGVYWGGSWVQNRMGGGRVAVLGVVVIIPCALYVPHVFAHFSELDRSRYYYTEDFGRNILRHLDQNSLIFMTGDQESSTSLYLQLVKQYRRDVIVLKNIDFVFLATVEGRSYLQHYYPTLTLPDSREDFREDPEKLSVYINEIIGANLAKRSVYSMSKKLVAVDEARFSVLPAAAFWQVVPQCGRQCSIDLKYWDLKYHDANYFKRSERALMSLKDPLAPGGVKRIPYIQQMVNFELQAWKNLGDWYVERGECAQAREAYGHTNRLGNSYSSFDYSESLKGCEKNIMVQ